MEFGRPQFHTSVDATREQVLLVRREVEIRYDLGVSDQETVGDMSRICAVPEVQKAVFCGAGDLLGRGG